MDLPFKNILPLLSCDGGDMTCDVDAVLLPDPARQRQDAQDFF